MSRKNFIFSCFALLASLMICPIVTQATDTVPMPSSGTCGFFLSLPIPYGADIGKIGGTNGAGTYYTGGSALGLISFTSSGAATLSATVVNPTYSTSNSPWIYATDNGFINNASVVILPMSEIDGFSGGYRFLFSGKMRQGINPEVLRNFYFEANVIPTNNGKTLLMQIANNNPLTVGEPGPGNAVCQFQ